jgi:hypothetical protein
MMQLPERDPKSMQRYHVPVVIALYACLTIIVTWPLATELGRAIPQTVLDPLLNCWILAWDCERLLGMLAGRISDLTQFWQGNIFHPAPDGLAYSEHLIPQAVQILPIYALTRNVLLGYNVLFLSTFVLSGLGAFCLVRELTGRPGPAVLAGILYMLLPYRADHYAHLQVLSSAWMPFAFLGLTLYFRTQRTRCLIGAAMALVVQGLSCGYYLLFFAPFVLLFVLFEMHRRRRFGDARTWRDLILASVAVGALTTPFLIPYLRVRERGDIERNRAEVISYSADLQSYASAPDPLRFWGSRLPNLGRSEVQLFMGLTPLILIGSAAGFLLWRRVVRVPRWPWPLTLLAGVLLLLVVMAGLVLTGHPQWYSVGPLEMRVVSAPRILAIAAVAAGGALAISEQARAAVASACRSVPVFLAVAVLLAAWLSLGPVVHSKGRPVPAFGLYGVLYDHVLGFDSLRVPARMGMLVGLFLSTLAGWAAAQLSRGLRSTIALVAVGGALALVEGCAAPITLHVPPACSLVYEAVAQLPGPAAVAEFPFGDPYLDVQYMFCSTRHWRRLVNGYSGAAPTGYRQRAAALGNVLRDPDTAWKALVDSGATHALVHEAAWPGAKGVRVATWLEAHGARRKAVDGTDVLYDLRVERESGPDATAQGAPEMP